MGTTIQDAARLLMIHSPQAAKELARRAPSTTPIYQQLYNRFAGDVLSDPSITLTPTERKLLSSFVTFPTQDTRTLRIQVRVSPSEQEQITKDAADAGMDVSAYVRARLGLSDLQVKHHA